MAKIFPNIAEDFHGSYGEAQIFKALKQLSDEWYIFHSLNWHDRTKNGRITWGEADFVIFHKSYGILVIEVKSGGISYKDNKWYQIRWDNNQENEMKNPFNQANRSKYKLIDEIDYKLSGKERCFVDKAVWFPSIHSVELEKVNLPLEYDKRLILTLDSLEKPLDAIKSTYNFYNSSRFTMLSDFGVNKVLEVLKPNFNLVLSASNVKEEVNHVLYQLTNEQKKVLDFIEEQRTIAIQGAAGTGKTFVAVEEAKRLSESGKVLFLCFNKFLYLHLNKNCQISNVDYYNLHTFLSKYSSDDLVSDEKCLQSLKNLDLKKFGYNAIIIDEAQDINGKIIDYFYDFAEKENIKFLIFYDKNQMLFQNKLTSSLEYFDCKLSLTKNCRNTVKILQTVNSVFNIGTEANYLSISGVMPILYFAENNYLDKLQKIIENFIDDGFLLNDIVILTLKSENESILNGVDKLGNFNISSYEKDESILFTTAKKFKGLESNAIIVIDFDVDKYVDLEYKKNLYVSFSRAKQRLSILTSKKNDLEILGSLIDGELDATIKVARKFKVKIDK